MEKKPKLLLARSRRGEMNFWNESNSLWSTPPLTLNRYIYSFKSTSNYFQAFFCLCDMLIFCNWRLKEDNDRLSDLIITLDARFAEIINRFVVQNVFEVSREDFAKLDQQAQIELTWVINRVLLSFFISLIHLIFLIYLGESCQSFLCLILVSETSCRSRAILQINHLRSSAHFGHCNDLALLSPKLCRLWRHHETTTD